MCRYCILDIILLELVFPFFLVTSPWMKGSVSMMSLHSSYLFFVFELSSLVLRNKSSFFFACRWLCIRCFLQVNYICFVGTLLLEPSASSSSSFMIASFLIQMLVWIRGSSRVESFVFSHFLRDLIWMARTRSSIAPIFSSLLMSRDSSSS